MPKKLFAVTNVKGSQEDGNKFYAAGEEIDPKEFSREQLKQLVDAGAAEIRDDSPQIPEGSTEPTPTPTPTVPEGTALPPDTPEE